MSGGEVGYYVKISRDCGYCNREGSPMGNDIGLGFRSYEGSSDVRVDGGESVGIEVYAPGGLSNWKSAGDIGGNPPGVLLGADSGMIIW